MPVYLLKTEPDDFSYEDLARDGAARWDGVSNAGALIALRTIRKKDAIYIYHTGAEKAVVGIARATSDAYEDPARPGTTDRGAPKFAVVDLVPVRALPKPVPLGAFKGDARCKDFALVKQGRLSVMVVPEQIDALLRSWAGL